ncbi:TPA: hypothetical protein N0F65_009602 [Lagenidium giganteum]|uniref:Uncharacterized protein n=1 Tax=Lagenidium giganteum TaxID=4803 RepID=A0AAV2YWX5_9STRA|nr:TPA: hypothetical protein N0F65_009602 [Lagenidium giganteum]
MDPVPLSQTSTEQPTDANEGDNLQLDVKVATEVPNVSVIDEKASSTILPLAPIVDADEVSSPASLLDPEWTSLTISAADAVDTEDHRHLPQKGIELTISDPVANARISVTELTKQRDRLRALIAQTYSELQMIDSQLQLAWGNLVQEEAQSLRDFSPSTDGQPRELVCVGFRMTDQCDPNGARLPDGDMPCDTVVPQGYSGYCEVQDRQTKERFRVMRITCNSIKWDSEFRCSDAPAFASFVPESDRALTVATDRGFRLPNVNTSAPVKQGIVMVVYPSLMPSAYATIRALRSFGCVLPIELWYCNEEMKIDNKVLQKILRDSGPATAHEISEPEVTGFATKIHAIYHSHLDSVLFLDADNVPVRDPTYLFSSREFQDTGAVFWPDFWHPAFTIFNIHRHSLLWQLVGFDFVDMFEQESGQILIDRRRSTAALEMLRFYTFHQPNLFDRLKVVHGDKDLFRLAWMKAGQSFTMINTPPGVAGKAESDLFCGVTMVQHDSSGDVIFLHRNSMKLKGRHFVEAENGTRVQKTDEPMWTHLLEFKPSSPAEHYQIDMFGGAPVFPHSCYGQKSLTSPHFNTFLFNQLPFRKLEHEILEYAIEASDLTPRHSMN